MCLMVCQVDELERKCRLQQEQIFNLKESLAHQQAEVKLKQTQFEGKQLFTLSQFTVDWKLLRQTFVKFHIKAAFLR